MGIKMVFENHTLCLAFLGVVSLEICFIRLLSSLREDDRDICCKQSEELSLSGERFHVYKGMDESARGINQTMSLTT